MRFNENLVCLRILFGTYCLDQRSKELLDKVLIDNLCGFKVRSYSLIRLAH